MRFATSLALMVAVAAAGVQVGSSAPALATDAPKVKLEKKPMNIQEVKSPGGIKAWLVEEHSVPLVAMRFSFRGGSAQDPKGKEGVAHFVSVMLDEGAGPYDSNTFQEREEDLAMRLSFSAGRDHFYGSFQSLSENLDETAELFHQALTSPRFEAAAAERMRQQLVASLAFADKNPNEVAGRLWAETAFPGHPYGRPAKGDVESVSRITPDDLKSYHDKVFARDNLMVAVVGDITPEALGKLLDKVFGGLGAKSDLVAVAPVQPAKGQVKVAEMPVPQSVAVFGFEGIARKDKDFVPAFVMNHILGGGGFSSKLMEEVREKRGLAYSVYSYLQPYDEAAIFAGGVATKNDKFAQSLDVIRGEIKDMATNGVTQEELDNAISYLTGSYALRFDNSEKIANQLLAIQQEDLGIDYVNKRNDIIRAVTVGDIKRVAGRMLKPDNLIVAVAGQPEGLAEKN